MNATVTMDGAGRLVLPVAVRKALGLKAGSRLILEVEGEEVHLRTMDTAIRRAQALLAPYRPKDGSLVSDQLIAERREEYRREQDGA
jgi:AbrB family looped-hinge helix DNA binding protein